MDIAAIVIAFLGLVVLASAGGVAGLTVIAVGLAVGIASLIRKQRMGGRIRMPIVSLGVVTFAFVVSLSVLDQNWDPPGNTGSEVSDSGRGTFSLTAPGKRTWYIEPSAKRYGDIREFVSDYPQDRAGTYLLTVPAYETLERDFGLVLRPEEAEKARWWTEQSEVHWPNVEAFQASMKAMSEDRVIDPGEREVMCFAHDQWTVQMTEARYYVRDYRRIDRHLVDTSELLSALEDEAERALALLAEMEC